MDRIGVGDDQPLAWLRRQRHDERAEIEDAANAGRLVPDVHFVGCGERRDVLQADLQTDRVAPPSGAR
jgi:hypothetical protein